jgi:hypothetical protein
MCFHSNHYICVILVTPNFLSNYEEFLFLTEIDASTLWCDSEEFFYLANWYLGTMFGENRWLVYCEPVPLEK